MQPGDRWVILTGAGVSADSGVQTFRGGGGLWEGHRVEDVATPEGWQRDPSLVWRFYQMRRKGLLEVEPNAAHQALARMQEHANTIGAQVTLISQNVDDLHQRAGSSVLAMHGQLRVLRCVACDSQLEGLEHLDPEKFLPCPECGFQYLRPDIVWFGEIPYHLDEIETALQQVTHFLACGTSGEVYPAAGLLAAARQMGAKTYVNALDRPSNLAPDDTFLPGPAARVIPSFVQNLIAT